MCAELRGNDSVMEKKLVDFQNPQVCSKRKASLCLLLLAEVKAWGTGELFSRSVCVCACMYIYVVLSICVNVESWKIIVRNNGEELLLKISVCLYLCK